MQSPYSRGVNEFQCRLQSHQRSALKQYCSLESTQMSYRQTVFFHRAEFLVISSISSFTGHIAVKEFTHFCCPLMLFMCTLVTVAVCCGFYCQCIYLLFIHSVDTASVAVSLRLGGVTGINNTVHCDSLVFFTYLFSQLSLCENWL